MLRTRARAVAVAAAAALTLSLTACGSDDSDDSNAADDSASEEQDAGDDAEEDGDDAEEDGDADDADAEGDGEADEEALKEAVAAYTAAFFAADTDGARAVQSERCHSEMDEDLFAGVITAANLEYGEQTVDEVEVDGIDGDTATVSYGIGGQDELAQSAESWTLENGDWKWDDC